MKKWKLYRLDNPTLGGSGYPSRVAAQNAAVEMMGFTWSELSSICGWRVVPDEDAVKCENPDCPITDQVEVLQGDNDRLRMENDSLKAILESSKVRYDILLERLADNLFG